MGRLDNKVAIITGGGMGMGHSAAILFAKEGAKVVVSDMVVEAGEKTVAEIKKAGGDAIFVKADVSSAKDAEKTVKEAVKAFGKVNILFSNAGIAGEASPTEDCTEENWEKVINVNLKGVWLSMKYAIPEIAKAGGGAIINTASQAAERAMPNLPAYTASKGGVLSLSRATAVECSKKNIRVNILEPGVIGTPMVLSMPDEAKASFVSAIPMGKMGTPEEVAYAALFLASDESSHITGHALAVDGGIIADSHTSC